MTGAAKMSHCKVEVKEGTSFTSEGGVALPHRPLGRPGSWSPAGKPNQDGGGAVMPNSVSPVAGSTLWCQFMQGGA